MLNCKEQEAHLPSSKVGVFLVVRRNKAVTVISAILSQVADFFLPRSIMAVPNKPITLQDLGPLRRHGRRLAFVHELVLAALPLHPTSKLRIRRVSVRDTDVARRRPELEKFRHHVIPSLLVKCFETARIGLASDVGVFGLHVCLVGGGLAHEEEIQVAMHTRKHANRETGLDALL